MADWDDRTREAAPGREEAYAPDEAEPLAKAAVARVLAGEDEAFAVVVHAYGAAVAQSLARRVPAQDVQEVAQDAFVRVYRSLPSWRGDAPLRAWVLMLAKAAAADHWRKRYRRRDIAMSDFDEAGQVGVEAAWQAEQAGRDADARRRSEARRLLAAGLAKLSPDDRAVITLVELEERSMEEAARELGCGLSAAKVRAFRARKRLRKALEELSDEERKEGTA